MFSCWVVSDSATPWTAARQAPLSMGLSRQEYWSGLPFPPPGDLPDPGIELMTPLSPALQVDSLLLSYQGKPHIQHCLYFKKCFFFFLKLKFSGVSTSCCRSESPLIYLLWEENDSAFIVTSAPTTCVVLARVLPFQASASSLKLGSKCT